MFENSVFPPLIAFQKCITMKGKGTGEGLSTDVSKVKKTWGQ